MEKLENIAEEILSAKGRVKGEVFLSHAKYIEYKEGEEGIEKVEKRMAELGAPIKMRKMSSLKWESVGVGSLLILVIREVLGWTEKDIYEMGRFSTKISFITKIFINYLVSKEKAFKESSRYWRRYFDSGSVEAKELADDYAIVQIKGFHVHPLICHLYAGYIHGMTEFIIKDKDITVEETKCTHKGDSCHEYKVVWK